MNKPVTRADWEGRAAALDPQTRPFIDGAFVESAGSERIEVVSPATETAFCRLPAGHAADIDRAVAAARRAFDDGRWRLRPLAERKAVLLRIAELIEQNRDELALIEALEVGKAVTKAHAEIAISVGFFRYYAEAIDKVYGEVAPTDGTLLAFSLLEPHGVVGAIVPWNFPLANVAYKAAPALAAGNSVVLKPSEVASLSALRLAELAMDAGLPPGVFNVVPGLGRNVGEPLARHPDVDFLSFTGSTRTGRELMRFAGESNGKPLMLECGGKSAQIICADMADELEPLAAHIVHDAFWNQGQWCSARSRLIVERPLYAPLIEAVAAAAAKLTPGHPLDPEATFGTIASGAQFERIQHYLDVGVREGAQLVLSGAHGAPCQLSMAPSIFGDVTPGMAVAREEIFGPVLCATPAADFEHALAIGNDTEYGLGGTIWTHDARRALSGARRLRAGRIAIRTSTSAVGAAGMPLAAEPVGASGFGVEKGLEGFRSYCRLRAVELL